MACGGVCRIKATSGLCLSDTSIETRLGGGAIMRREARTLCNTGIDHHGRALARFQCDDAVERVHGCTHLWMITRTRVFWMMTRIGWEGHSSSKGVRATLLAVEAGG